MASLVDLINQLINEHGSAPILHERISRIKEHAAFIEKELSLCESKTSALKAENEAQKTEIINLQKQNADLDEVIKTFQNHSHNDLLLKISRMKWGCITFPPDDKLYCPACFHKAGKKIETLRVDSRNRFCAVCRTNLPSG